MHVTPTHPMPHHHMPEQPRVERNQPPPPKQPDPPPIDRNGDHGSHVDMEA